MKNTKEKEVVLLLNMSEFRCLLKGMEDLLEGWSEYTDEMEDQESDAYTANRTSCLAFIQRYEELKEIYSQEEAGVWDD